MKRLALAALLVLSGCPAEKKAPEVHQTVEQQFWTSFAFDEAAFADLARQGDTGAAAAMQRITQLLARFNKGIVAEIAVEKDPAKPHTVVFTTNGDSKLFPVVKALVAQAPKLKNWNVVAFRQRRPDVESFKLGSFTVLPSDYTFKETGREKGLLDIEVRVKGMTDENQRMVDQATFLILDHTLGEYDVETKLGAIDIKPAPVAVDPAFQPMSAIAALVDAMPAK